MYIPDSILTSIFIYFQPIPFIGGVLVGLALIKLWNMRYRNNGW